METHSLTLEQTKAVESKAARLLIIAGAGSGKTTVLIQRIARLIEDGCDPSTIACVTFTNNAASEIAKRLTAFVPDAKLGFTGTIHSLALRLLEKHGALIGYAPNIATLDEEHADNLLFDMADLIGYNKVPKTHIRAARDAYSTEARNATPMTPALAVVAAYYKRLKQGNAIDFRGLLSEAARLLNHSAWCKVLFDHLLVDEFQDVCDHDVKVFDALRPTNMCCVGDPEQSIYKFRGGQINHILTLASSVDWSVVKLEDNFRCDKSICEAAQRLIEHNTDRVKKVTRSATGKLGVAMVMTPHHNETQEAATIFTNIQELLANGHTQPHDIAVLARTNVIMNELRSIALGYNFPIEAGPRDDEETPGWKFCRATVEMLACTANNMAFEYWLALRYNHEHAKKIRAAATTAQKTMAEIFFVGGAPHVKALLQDVSFLLANFGCHTEAITRTCKIIATLPPDATVADLSLAMRHQVGIEEKRNGVVIATMHASKGREFSVVYLAGMEQQVIPGGRAGMQFVSDGFRAVLEEERRVCYVAATRAKNALIISYAAQRKQPFGQRKLMEHTPSQFICEMGLHARPSKPTPEPEPVNAAA